MKSPSRVPGRDAAAALRMRVQAAPPREAVDLATAALDEPGLRPAQRLLLIEQRAYKRLMQLDLRDAEADAHTMVALAQRTKVDLHRARALAGRLATEALGPVQFKGRTAAAEVFAVTAV